MGGFTFDWHYLSHIIPGLLDGLRVTVEIALTCIALSLLVGYVGATVIFFDVPVVRRFVEGYVAVIRNTPMLVQLFFFYFGLPEIGIRTDALSSGVIVLSIWSGAYQIENLRGAVQNLPKPLLENIRALGIRPASAYLSIIAPVATRTVLPAMMNTAVSTTKNSALLTAIGVPELTYVAMDNIAFSSRAMENFFALFVGYVTVVLCMSAVSTVIESRLGRGFKR
ncbi:amino acid ABC transporter permease [Paraburkholderia caledonica]|uniref:Polar amino acid transport system permease protein n=1 Tax=Paraburkholderia caledonica TaxID=134536 RepID=A0AB73IMP4_9BURK|nr:polar amino acid transport system permease protein [Paraburkholderia caledonica]